MQLRPSARTLIGTLCAAQLAVACPARGAAPEESEEPDAEASTEPEEEPAEPEVPDEASELREQAVLLWNEGHTRFKTADFTGAIEKFTEALLLLDNAGGNPSSEAVFMENLAEAHAEAYGIDGDVKHLRQAVVLYDDLLGRPKYELTGSAQSGIEAKRAKIQRTLDEATRAPEPEPRPITTDRPKHDRNRALTISGATLLGLGGALTGAMVAGLALSERSDSRVRELEGIDEEQERMDEVERGRAYNKLAMGAGIAAGIVVITGVGLLTVGLVRKRKSAQRATVSPMLGPRTSGLIAAFRF